MVRLVALLIMVMLLPLSAAFGGECSVVQYEALVVSGKKTVEAREWARSVEVYGSIIADCRSLLSTGDLAKAYDALAFGQLMQGDYTAAIDSAKLCLEAEAGYNACLMTAAKASEATGDTALARQYAEEAIAVGAHDDYSAATVISARDFLKKLEKR